MKLSLLPQIYFPRRSNSFRSTSSPHDAISGAADSPNTTHKPPPASPFWLLLHCLCCLASLILGFRFSRVVFFLLFSAAATTTTTLYTTTTTTTLTTITTTTAAAAAALTLPLLPTAAAAPNHTHSRVAVGRHGIRIRPWPHPNAEETMRAHQIIERVQAEQRTQYGIKKPRPLVVVTPTYVRAFQALHLTALMHSLMLVPYDLTWVVVEAGGVSNETASILDRSQLNYIHVPFHEGKMPLEWAERHKVEARMRLHALRMVRERRMDGIVLFADDSNIHSMELFDEIQKVKWMGAVSVGILTHSGISERNEEGEDLLVPIQGPDCSSAGKLTGWNTFNSLPNVGEGMKLEWAGFALNSRLLWEDDEGKPDWVRNLDDVGMNGEEVESPLALVKDASSVEPLGNCGNKVLLWWLRAEARTDAKFPAGWIIDHSLDVPAKNVPWRTRH